MNSNQIEVLAMSNVTPGRSSEIGGSSSTPFFSVCVIGRNEAASLSSCGESLRALDKLGVACETIYVDSASTDASVVEAMKAFDRVLVLADSPHLNASAGRYVGTLAACGKWMIYLDGDMLLSSDFLPRLAELREDGRNGGIVGHTRNVYPDGATSLPLAGYNRHGRTAQLFGGACVLRREDVLAAGNWNPRLYANEEAELYGRLRSAGTQVTWYDDIFVDHHTARIPRLQMLHSALWPRRSVLGKKYYGPGQAMVAGWQGGTLSGFLWVKKEPLLYLAGFAIAALLVAMQLWLPAAIIAGLVLATAAANGGVARLASYVGWLSQVLFGLSRYPAGYAPTVERSWSRAAGWTSSTPADGLGE